jgi:hypothetical protein
MKKNYTLNRFYTEAKALIEKHNCKDDNYTVRVQFEITEDKEKNGSPKLNCRISYENNHDYAFYASKRTPEYTLQSFEEKLLESKDKWPPPQTISIDLIVEPILTECIEESD